MLQFQVTPNVLFIFPKTPRCKRNKTTHTQLLGALLKNSGLASEGDMAKLDWFIIENIFRIIFYKFSKKKSLDPTRWYSLLFFTRICKFVS
jgi:hypothetical protein